MNYRVRLILHPKPCIRGFLWGKLTTLFIHMHRTYSRRARNIILIYTHTYWFSPAKFNVGFSDENYSWCAGYVRELSMCKMRPLPTLGSIFALQLVFSQIGSVMGTQRGLLFQNRTKEAPATVHLVISMPNFLFQLTVDSLFFIF